MKVETYKCDVCGKQKGDVNHWWMFVVSVPSISWFSVKAWVADEADRATFHLCGAECVHAKVSEFLGKTA